jgi:hypothetical protein
MIGLHRFRLMLLMALVIAASAVSAIADPIRVELHKTTGGFELLRGGKPYFIKGAGGSASMEVLKQCGGNSTRTWGSDTIDQQLDEAEKLGMTVTVGVWIGHAEAGFNWDDDDAVAAQFERAKAAVIKYRNHPAVLMWAFGNEMEGYHDGDNPKVWKALEAMGKMAHQLDPNHPTMTVMADIGGSRIPCVNAFCPDIDIVGVNSYGGGPSLAKRYRDGGGIKPFVLTEFGPPGQWETDKNKFGVPHELTSTQKAAFYRLTYESAILPEKGKLCLGSYVFAWGWKQEATATWYGLFLPDHSRLGAVDTMTDLWGGKMPAVRCPQIEPLAADKDEVDPGATIQVKLTTTDPDSHRLKTTWVLAQDQSMYANAGGETQPIPTTYNDAIVSGDNTGCELKMPSDGGGYILYAYVRDDAGGAAVANIPLHVHGDPPPPKAQKVKLPFVLYGPGQKDLPYIWSGWTASDMHALHMDEKCTVQPHAGDVCMKCQFTDSQGWAGIIWQSPANDWGDKFGGYNISGASKLTFWARGETGGEIVNFRLGVIKDKKFNDTASASLENVKLTTHWKQYSIDLTGKDLSDIKTGFSWGVAAAGSPITFYLSQVQYE